MYWLSLPVSSMQFSPASVEKSTVPLPEKSPSNDLPLTGEEIAEAEFPSVGTKYIYQIVTEKESYKRSFLVIEDGLF